MYTLSVIFTQDTEWVLTCFHHKQKALNFVGGKVEEGEDYMDASYRELYEETGIRQDEVDLKFLRCEHVTTGQGDVWGMYITTGILKEDILLVPEKNDLRWLPVLNVVELLDSFSYGSCTMYLLQACDLLGIENPLHKFASNTYVGANIKSLRKGLGLSQEVLGKNCGVTDFTINAYENGYRLPDIATAHKLADVFNVSINTLYNQP